MNRNSPRRERAWDRELAAVFLRVRTRGDMERLLEEVFTRRELRDLGLRWRLMVMLRRGRTQRRIAADLGISLCKITRGARVLKDRRSVVRRLIGHKDAGDL